MHPIYGITSIGRPIDPAWPTNRALLVVLVAVALVGAVLAWIGGAGAGAAVGAGLRAALLAFGAWALARELAPDHDLAAFLAVAFALGLDAWLTGTSLLLLFTALLLVRVVNRSTGLAARWHDSVLVTGLVAWAMTDLDSPWLGVTAALAFALDARLRQPLRRQWGFALLCLGLAAGVAWRAGAGSLRPDIEPSATTWLALGILLAFLGATLATRRVAAPGDIGGAPLLAARVRGGMLVAWLVALQACLQGRGGIAVAGALLGTFGAVAVWRVLPRLRRGEDA